MKQSWTRWFFISTLTLLAAYGAYLRADHLSLPAFSEDEFLHVFSAKSLTETGRPVLWGDREYTRALPFTYLVSFSFRLLGAGEFSARAVTVLFDLLTLLLVYLIAAKFIHPVVGWISVALLATSPLSIAMARYTRMYTLHGFLYLGVFWLVFEALEKDAESDAGPEPERARARRKAWGILALAGVLALFNLKIQELSVFFASGFAVYCVCDVWRRAKVLGAKSALRTLPGIGVFLICGAAAGVLLLPQGRAQVVQALTWLPDWAKSNAGDYFFYRWVFMEHHSFLNFFVLPGAYFLIRRRPKFGLYLMAGLAVPLLILSLLPLKSERYVFNVYPLLLVWIASGIYFTVSEAARFASAALKKPAERSAWAGEAFAMVAACAMIACTPGYALARKIHRMESGALMGIRYLPWREVMAFLQVQPPDDKIIVSRPSAFLYYLRRPDYSINRMEIVELKSKLKPGENKIYDMGVPYLGSLAELTEAVDQSPRAWLIIEDPLLQGRKNRLSPDEIRFIHERFELVQKTRDGSLAILRRKT